MKAAAAVAEILKREGVKFLIGYPVNQIIEAAGEADIRTITVRQERPRPVLVEFPVDVLREDVPEPLNYKPVPRLKVAPDPKDVSRIAAVLVAAERPVIYAGQGVHYAKAWPQLKVLAELLEAPVTTSLQGKSAFPETHPLSLGSGGRSISKQLHHFLTNADVVFGIGCSFTTTN